jgi:peptidoglycan/LPS O-acetylase OafA/YrhL
LIFWLTRKSNIYIPFSLTICILVILLFTYGDGSLENTVFPIFWLTFFGNALAFYSGIFLGRKMLHEGQFPFIESKNNRYTLIGVAGIMIVLAILERAHHPAVHSRYILRIIGNIFLLPVPVAILLYGLIKENSLLRRVLASNIFRLSGRASYLFYLLHIPVIDYIGKPYIYPIFSKSGYDIYVALTFLITLILSLLLFKFYEHPLNNWIRKLARREKKVVL